MIQDIFPHHYDNSYRNVLPFDKDLVLPIFGEEICCRFREENGELELPDAASAERIWGIDRTELRYLFRIDDTCFFLCDKKLPEAEGYAYRHPLRIRGRDPQYLSFAAPVGAHLAHWYATTRFCGRCGAGLTHSRTQRAMVCPSCGLVCYPRISPIVITAVTDGDYILCARYNKKHFDTRSSQYVLIAGYVEIGESYEDTVRREVREETGLEIRNIRYIGSQPWPFSQTSIAGFYAEADRRRPLKRQEDELSELIWLRRTELPPRENLTSITDNLYEWFRNGKTVEEILKDLR